MSIETNEFYRINNLHLLKGYGNPLKALAFALTPNGSMRLVTVYPPYTNPTDFIAFPIPKLSPYVIMDHIYLRFKNNDPHFRKKAVIRLRNRDTRKLYDTIWYWILPHKELEVKIPEKYLLEKGILTAEKFIIDVKTGRHVDKYTAFIPHRDF